MTGTAGQFAFDPLAGFGELRTFVDNGLRNAGDVIPYPSFLPTCGRDLFQCFYGIAKIHGRVESRGACTVCGGNCLRVVLETNPRGFNRRLNLRGDHGGGSGNVGLDGDDRIGADIANLAGDGLPTVFEAG